MKLKKGAVLEFSSSEGYAYAQYVNDNEDFGELIRVFRGMHVRRPAVIEDVVQGEELVLGFFPLRAAIRRGIVEVVGTAPISEADRVFPIFKDGLVNPESGETYWWLWDGTKEWPVGELTAEQERYPLRRAFNDTYVVELVAEDAKKAAFRRPNGC